MEKSISTKNPLIYFNFSRPFINHTHASKVLIGSIISQESKPITFYSRKLNPLQVNYITIERELLFILETLKEFRIYLQHFIEV